MQPRWICPAPKRAKSAQGQRQSQTRDFAFWGEPSLSGPVEYSQLSQSEATVSRCPPWVKLGHSAVSAQCPVSPKAEMPRIAGSSTKSQLKGSLKQAQAKT